MRTDDAGRIWMNKSELCRSLELSRPTINKHLAKSEAPKATERHYDYISVVEFIQTRQSTDNNGGNPLLDHEKLRGQKLSNIEKEMEIAEKKKKLIDRVVFTGWIGEQFGGLKQRLLGLAPSIAPRLARKSKRDVVKILSHEIERVLNQFADVHEKRSEELAKMRTDVFADEGDSDDKKKKSKKKGAGAGSKKKTKAKKKVKSK